MGLSVEQQRELAQQRTAILLLTKQQELASVQAADAESGTMSRRAIAMQEEIRLIQARESLLNVKLEQEQTINNFKSAWASVDQTAHDVFVNIFQGGQDVFSKLTNVLKSTLLDLLYQMTVKKWLFNITAAVTGTSAGMANAAMGAATGGGGGAGSLLSSLGSLTGGTGLLGAAGLGLQSGFGALMSGGLAGVGAAVQGGLAAIGTGMGASVAAGLGTIAGALGPIALGIGVAYKLLSGKKDSRFGSAYNYTPDSGTQIVGGPNQGVDYAGQSSSINSVAAAINAVLTKVGSGDRLAQLGAGFESSVKGKGFSYAGGSLTSGASFGQQDVYNNRGNKSIEQAMAEYQTELKQATLQALQAASGVPRVIAEKLYSVNLDALGDQALSGLIAAIDAQIAQVDGFRAAVVSLPFENLKNLSFDAAAGLIAAAGGFESLSTKLTSYMDNYYSAEEKRLRTITQINAATAGSGLNAATATRQSFRMLVEAQDLTTTHGQANYAALLNVADAFAALTPVLEKVNDGRQALINSYEAEASALKSTIDRFKDFAQSLRSFRDGLLTGGMSPLTPEQRYAAAGSQFDKIMLGTQTGTQAEREVALGQLQGAASTLLEASKTRNASGAEYITDFLRVQEALSGAAIGALATVDVAQLQLGVATSQLAALNQINDTLQGNGRTTSGEGFFRTQDPSTVGSIRKDDSMVTALLLKVEELTGEVRALREQQSHETLEQINATYGAASTGASALASAQSKAAWSQPAALV